MRFTKRVIAQGQVTVPSDLRTVLGIDAGDLVEFEVVGITRRSAVARPSGPAVEASRQPSTSPAPEA